MIDDPELMRELRTLSPKAKAALAQQVDARLSAERKLWFCDVGSTCDGKPHGKFNYPHARADQWPPPGIDWLTWLIRGGRGSGKSRTGAEYTRNVAKKIPWIALVGPTAAAARDVMVEGESGIIVCCERAGEKVDWEPSKRRITFPSGARATLFSAEEPDRLRGPQHGFAWADEPAHWPNVEDVWDMLLFGMRLPPRPHILATTTPIPSEWMIETIEDPLTRSVGVSTYANIDNLAPIVAERILKRYEGTRLGRQEIYGEIVADVEGALWSTESFVYIEPKNFLFDRIVVAIDPAGSTGKRSDMTGVVVVALLGENIYVLEDATAKYSPAGWARKAMGLYEKWSADAIVAEKNFGGDMVESNMRNNEYKGRLILVRATDGKRVRAEPISALYEQGRAFHARGLEKLEGEMVSWIPGQGSSPNRVDALVWGATDLLKTTSSGIANISSAHGRLGGAPNSGPGTKRGALAALGLRKR